MSRRYSKYIPFFVFLSDLAILNGALFFSHLILFTYKPSLVQHELFLLFSNLSWIFVSFVSKNFLIKRPLILQDNINRFLLTLIYHLLLLFAIIYFFKIHDISRSEVLIGYSLFFVLIFIHRSLLFFLLDFYRKKGFNHRKILIIGDEIIANRLVKSFSQHPEYGYDLTDFLSEDKINTLNEDELNLNILSKRPDEIFICYKKLDAEFLKQLILIGDENSIKIKVVSDLFLDNKYAQLVNYDNVPVLQITASPEISIKIKLLKRCFDVAFSLLVMVIGFPFFVIIYFITKFTSPGPAFYKQERIGRNEKPFYIFKFRSMYLNAEKHGPQLSKDNDPRITKWGVFLRKTRFDELPQFWNVLRGDMSVVGPRPERQHFIEKIIEKTPSYKKLLKLKPGITSIGQVHYGYAENIDEMCTRVRYDLIYLDKISLKSDLNIILKTVKVMVQGKGK